MDYNSVKYFCQFDGFKHQQSMSMNGDNSALVSRP